MSKMAQNRFLYIRRYLFLLAGAPFGSQNAPKQISAYSSISVFTPGQKDAHLSRLEPISEIVLGNSHIYMGFHEKCSGDPDEFRDRTAGALARFPT